MYITVVGNFLYSDTEGTEEFVILYRTNRGYFTRRSYTSKPENFETIIQAKE